MLFIKTYNKDINGNRLPDGEYVKEYTITQGDTFTLTITDPNGVMQGGRFKLGREDYAEWFTQDFIFSAQDNKWICTVPTTSTNDWELTKGTPYIYEIEATLTDGNKVSITKYYFNVVAQVGDD